MRSTALSLRLAGAALLILASAPAIAADAASPANSNVADAGGAPATTAAPAEKPKKEKRICRSDNATGSNLRSTKICLTREEWRARS